MRFQTHSAFVEHWHPDDTYDAACSCGWETFEWENEESAQEAADLHLLKYGSPTPTSAPCVAPAANERAMGGDQR